MTITAEQVKLLRDSTGGSVMDCKKALVKSGGDQEEAALYLRALWRDRADELAKEN